jgi:hypothetical protein
MSWIITFIQCAVQIILSLLGFWNPMLEEVTLKNVSHYECAEPRWETELRYNNGAVSGDIEVVCTFGVTESNNLIGLRQLLYEKLQNQSLSVHGQEILNYNGMPGIKFDHTLDLSNESGVNEIRGFSHIATDGFTKLSSVFEAASQQSGRAIFGARSIRTETHVEKLASGDNEFVLRMINHVNMNKPILVGAQIFYQTVADKTEVEMGRYAENVTLWVANNM